MRPVLDGLFVSVPAVDALAETVLHSGRPLRPLACMRTAPLVILASALAGCFVPEGRHTIRFELAQEPPGPVVTDRKSFFFWGLVPTAKVDVRDKCPNGTVAIVDGSDAGGAPWIPTLGLWSRRATTYYCRQSPSSEAPR